MKETRTCVACKVKKDKHDLLRVVKTADGCVVDSFGKTDGRGAYVCKDKKCLDLAIKKKAFNRSFKMNIENSFYEQLGEYGKN